VLKTLKNAHRKGIVHRDIKPANLFETKGKVKLLDFGMADTMRNPIIPQGDFIGTPGFAPPEQLHGHKATPKSDVWSLGATAYTSLTDQEVTECPPPPVQAYAPDVPDDIAGVIDRSLACNPRSRPTADKMLQQLSPHLHHMLAMQAAVPAEPMSTGAKIAIGVVIAGTLFSAYQIASFVSDAFAKTPPGQWLMALPPGAFDELERISDLGYFAAWPEFKPDASDTTMTEVSALVVGTTFPWPQGTRFWRAPKEVSATTHPAKKTASGPGTTIAVVFVAFLAAAGVVAWKANQLVEAFQAKGIEIVAPGDLPRGTIADAVTVQGVFNDVLGSSIGPSVLNSALANGWRYAAVPTSAKSAMAAQTAAAKTSSGPTSTVEDTLYVDPNGKQWVGNLNPDGTFNQLEPSFRLATGVVPGHFYKMSPIQKDGSYTILADLTTGAKYA